MKVCVVNKFRISKYDPAYRVDGIYTRDEWTDYSDIGQSFEGKICTKRRYLQVEKNYVSCAMEVLQKSSIDKMKISSLESHWAKRECLWHEGEIIDSSRMPQLIRDILRNKCWCFISSDDAYLHFAFDFYMYIGCNISVEDVGQICRNNNLFYELRSSPLLNSDNIFTWDF